MEMAAPGRLSAVRGFSGEGKGGAVEMENVLKIEIITVNKHSSSQIAIQITIKHGPILVSTFFNYHLHVVGILVCNAIIL